MEPTSRIRKAAAVLTLFAGLFLAASVVSFDPADPPSDAAYPPNIPPHNWCRSLGAYVAYGLLSTLGDGTYPLLLFVLAGAYLWISGSRPADKLLRALGAAMLVLAVSVASAMIAAESRLPQGNGGVLGFGAWMFLDPRLGTFGTVLLLVPVALVAFVLLTDNWLVSAALTVGLALVGLMMVTKAWLILAALGVLTGVTVLTFRLLRDRAMAPYKEMATAALATAGARLRGFAGGLATAEADEEEDTVPKPRVRKQRPAGPESATDEEDDAPPARAVRGKASPSETDEDEAEETGDDEPSASAAPPLPRNIVIRHARPAAKEDQAPEDEDFAFTPPASTPRNQDYPLPPVDLLEDAEPGEGGENEEHIRRQADVLTETLREFGVAAEVVAVETGPVVTQYELALAPGIKVGKVIGLSDDLAISLKAPNVRIVAPLPGKDTIGVEVPNTSRQIVRMKEIVLAAKDAPARMGLPLFLGKDSMGEPLVKDIAGMPHLLIAGTTGSGKSVCLNSIIMSLLLTRTPVDLKMVLIDPKMVELSVFKRLPHLLCPVVNDMRKAEAILGWLVDKMEERYRTLSAVGVRNIAAYNRVPRETILEIFHPESPEQEARIEFHMPHICVIVDELADLMMVAAKEVESHVTRLSQKSRAVGIHLIMATQRPSVDVLTGLIKSNLPIRVSFQVASRVDSRTILDSMGAEKLLGQGDMLFMTPGAHKFVRAQGGYVSDTDIQRVLDFITQKAEPEFQRELVQLKAGDEAQNPDEDGLLAVGADDQLYNQSIEIVLEHQRGSVSLLQRRLGIGYGRAARLIDQMAEDGIVGEYKGSQAREVVLTLEQWQALKQRRRADEESDESHLTEEEAALDT